MIQSWIDRSIIHIEELPVSPISHPTSTGPRIAVAGATGRVGAALTARLAEDRVNVLALTRKPDEARLSPGVAVAGVDFDEPASLVRALRGVDRLFLAHGTSPRQVANEIALTDAAVAGDVGHIVKLSALGPPSRLHPFDWHMSIEAHLATQSIGYTVLRPSSFVDILRRAGAAVANDSWGGAAGFGSTNFIDPRDVADAAYFALLDEPGMKSQRAYHLTGSRAWTMQEIARELSRLLDREVIYRDRTAAEQRAELLADGTSDFVADLLLGLDQVFRESVLAETTSTVEALTGHAPRPLTQWLAENISLFQKK
jgi:NAD(P)H dehydrogenase (quinone)